MSNPIVVMPDPLLAVQQYLASKTEITTLIAAAKIVTEIPFTSPSYPYVVLQWGGGLGIRPGIDEPSIQVDVIGKDKGDKALVGKISRTIRAVIWAIANDVVVAGTLVSGSDEMPPSWMPDTINVPPLPRYVARYRILLHP
jgi:hypothetical protein